MDEEGKFALKWHIYGLDYGVPIQIDDWLSKGHSVIINVSRNIISEARRNYENIVVIFIQVPFEITLQRIKSRGRESGKSLDERIERARELQTCEEADFVVDNSRDLNNAIEQFLKILLKSLQ